MIIKIDKAAIIQYLLLYLCFLNTSSEAANMYGNTLIVISFAFCCFLLAIRRIQVQNNYLLFILALIGAIFVQHVAVQGNISINSMMNTLTQCLLAYCAVAYDSKNFCRRFIKISVVIALFSLICYVISLTPLSPLLKIVLVANDSHNWTGKLSYGRFIYHYMEGYPRNVGLYREPGVFQLFLNLALYFLLFKNEKLEKKKIASLVILLLAIVSAASTAGYITTAIILGGYVLQNKPGWGMRRVYLITAFLIALGIFSQTELFQTTFTEKLQFSSGSFSYGTGNARLASILIDLRMIAQNIWGYGYSGAWVNTSTIASQETGSSVGLTSIITVYGVPIAMIIYAGYIYGFRRVSSGKLEFVILLAMFISSFLSQPWVLAPAYLMCLSYGFVKAQNMTYCQ